MQFKQDDKPEENLSRENAVATKRVGMKLVPGGNQMCLIRDTEEVIKFLECAGRKHILNDRAVNCRLTACNNLFSVLNEEEDNLDYIIRNLDVLVNRFRNRNQNVRSSTLKVYKSRAKSSIEDFQCWSADPFAWERKVTEKARTQTRLERKPKKIPAPAATESALPATVEVEVAAPSTSGEQKSIQVSFPIRKDFIVEMKLPASGITAVEWRRLGLFLFPYCQDLESMGGNWKIPNDGA